MRGRIVILALAALFACEQKAPVPPAQTPAALTVNVIDCGSIKMSDLDGFSSAGDYKGVPGDVTVPCFLINHPSGKRLLWDLGLPGMLAGLPAVTQDVFTVKLEKKLTAHLKALGLTPDQIDFVSISHSHFDHIGQARQFPNATWIVHQKEQDAMFPPDGTAPAGDKMQIDHFAHFAELKRDVFTGDKDVFGDGSVVIFETPGHTPGHTSLQLQMPESGTVFLTGDLYHLTKSRDLKRVPRFNFSEPQTIAAFKLFEDRVAAVNGKVIIQHEKADIEPLGGVIK